MRKEVTVIFHPLNRVAQVPVGTNLLSALRCAGIMIESICGGKGECGKCRVIIDSGDYTEQKLSHKSHLSPAERDAGYRLACEITIAGAMEVTIPVESRVEHAQILCGLFGECDCGGINPSVVRHPLEIRSDPMMPFQKPSIRLVGYTGPRPVIPDRIYETITGQETRMEAVITRTNGYPEILDVMEADEGKPLLGLALDLGTTTIACAIVDLETDIVLAEATTLNGQITYGEEVITRIGFTRKDGGLFVLQEAAVKSINAVIDSVTESAGVQREEVLEICIGGNTVMTHLVAGLDPAYLELADAAVFRTPIICKAAGLGIRIHPEAYCYCLPNVSRFVGGDAVGGVLISGLHCSSEISLFIDLGTNGEIIIGNRDWIASVSCASGPAFEGAGISSGMRAMRGAIERIRVDPGTGLAMIRVIGGTRPRGICGSGLIDLVTGMFRAGILDFKGKFTTHPRVRMTLGGAEYVVVGAEESATGRDIVITQDDMDYFMDSKAALSGGIGVLLKKYRLSVWDIREIHLAGAFGAFVDIGNTVAFGIIPSFPNAVIHPVGNTSLKGAYAALISVDKRREAERIAEMMVYIDLLVDTDFIEEYTAALFIPGREEYFPDIPGEK